MKDSSRLARSEYRLGHLNSKEMSFLSSWDFEAFELERFRAIFGYVFAMIYLKNISPVNIFQ